MHLSLRTNSARPSTAASNTISILRFLGAILLLVFGRVGECVENDSTPMKSHFSAISLVETTLCKTKTAPCDPVTSKINGWFNCRNEPGGCYEKEVLFTLQQGEEVLVELPAPDAVQTSSSGDRWVHIETNYCAANNCDGSHISGWLRRSQVALLTEFRPLKKWPRTQVVHVYLGDYAATIHIKENATFRATGAIASEVHNYPEHKSKGRLYRFGNILWAKPANKSDGFFFVGQPDLQRFCWNQGDGFLEKGHERYPEENSCFPADGELNP